LISFITKINTSKYHISHYYSNVIGNPASGGDSVSLSLTIEFEINKVNHVFNMSLDKIIPPRYI
jgi:hypothetical protein